ncbi:MAG: CoA pyrophosphatase [Alcanivorax sp.]|uniref:CoA pyrophosphatase n=1 Tax=Alloalcanivorax marinus TaxID=1177169 RepID=A0A9Q3UMG0_9GAMM|nr:CoA pyrophosphatase [Alloalcanivorax marinus]MCC4308077.1 CoA pyrophosphatase [Alloalcanivorax marinus]MCU5785852.1 MutT/nudix family protein [Alloalcanivorax marinus]
MLDLLRQRMAAYPYNDLPVALPEAAVLMPFVDQPEPELILTVRAQGLSTHAGQVAFPGGKRDPEDPDLKTTALRESLEEVGLPDDQVEVVGNLSPVPSRFGIKVTPFVGLVRPGVSLVPEPGEIETIFQVPLSFFLDQPPRLSAPVEFYGRRLRMPSYHYEDKHIWGLTAFMILDLINHVYDADVRFDLTGEQ